jgi:hypothetical protein
LVVGDDVGALLRVRPAARNHDRDFAIAELPRSQDPRVSRYNSAHLVSEHAIMSVSSLPGTNRLVAANITSVA